MSLVIRRRPNLIDLAVVIFLIAISVAWVIVAGKDLNWDQRNYHFYLPYSLFGDRLGTDFMAANVQSYLNPFPYVPFYWMVTHHWPSMLIGGVLASLHATNVVLAYFIGKALIPVDKGRQMTALLGALLAFLSPIFLLEVGTTFADVTTSVLILLSVLIALHVTPAAKWHSDRALYAGLFIGLAAGLKLTNLIFGPACALMIASLPLTSKYRMRALLLFAIGGIAGLLMGHGYWSSRLWSEFGNPFFPLFNSIFNSPDYPAVSIHHERFTPETVLDVILLPFRIMQLRSWLYVESVSPDLRFAALVVAGFVFAVSLVKRRFADKAAFVSQVAPQLRAMLVFFLSAFVLWAVTSGNGRYGIAISILCGPLLAVLVRSIVGNTARSEIVTIVVLGSFIALQGLHLSKGRMRWDESPWTRTWYEPKVPQQLISQPYLYISLGPSSNTYVVPYLASGSAFFNHVGQVSFDLDGPGGARISALIAKYKNRVRMITVAPTGIVNDKSLTRWGNSADNVLARLGFKTDLTDCLTITTAGSSRTEGVDFTEADTKQRSLLTCGLKEKEISAADIKARAEVRVIFEKVVRACPQILQPDYTVVEKVPGGWFSSYLDTDSALRLDGDQLVITQPRASQPLFLGTREQWAGQSPPAGCERFPTRLRRIYNFD